MKTTNKRRYESLNSLLALCEQHKEPLEAMPLGKPFLDTLRQSVSKTADAFKGQSDGRNASHEASAARSETAAIVRQQADDLLRTARVLGAPSGTAINLPRLPKRSDQQLIADARSVLDHVAPLAAVFRARGVTDYDELPKWIAWLDKAVEAHADSRRPGGAAMSDALRKGAEAAVELRPLFLAAVHGDYYRAAEWSRVRWTGPARARKRQSA